MDLAVFQQTVTVFARKEIQILQRLHLRSHDGEEYVERGQNFDRQRQLHCVLSQMLINDICLWLGYILCPGFTDLGNERFKHITSADVSEWRAFHLQYSRLSLQRTCRPSIRLILKMPRASLSDGPHLVVLGSVTCRGFPLTSQHL